MPFIPNKKKIECNSPEHNPPSMMVFPPEGGLWVCPVCGKETIIHPAPTLK